MAKKKRCQKRPYATAHEARLAIEGMAKRYRFVYKSVQRCAECKAFHLTGSPPRRGRRIQR